MLRNDGSIYPGRVALCRRTDGSAESGIFKILGDQFIIRRITPAAISVCTSKQLIRRYIKHASYDQYLFTHRIRFLSLHFQSLILLCAIPVFSESSFWLIPFLSNSSNIRVSGTAFELSKSKAEKLAFPCFRCCFLGLQSLHS